MPTPSKSLWSDIAARYADAQAVFPWSDVGQIAIADRAEAEHAGPDAIIPSRTGNFATAPRASHSGHAILVHTDGDGGWKVLVRERRARPTDIPPGPSMLCRLAAPTGALVIHESHVVLSLHEYEDGDPYHPLDGEQVTATVTPGTYLVQVTRPDLDDYDGDEPDETRAPDYLVDLWPELPGEPVTLTWQRLG